MVQSLARRTIGQRWRMGSTDSWLGLALRLLGFWRRHCQRRELLDLDDRLLRDIGITRNAARMEARRRWWQ